MAEPLPGGARPAPAPTTTVAPPGPPPAETYQVFSGGKNPFTPLVRSYRRIFLDGQMPDWRGLVYFTALAVVIFIFGYWWFARTRKSFADVV